MRLRHALVPLCLFAVVAATVDAAPPRRSRDRVKIVTKTKFDPAARQVDFFEAQEEGSIEVQLIAKDSTGGNLLVKNSTDETLSVALPQSFVGMPVLKQFGGFPGGGLNGGGGLPGGGLGGTGANQTGVQPVGGGTGAGALGGGNGLGGLGGGAGLGGGGNFFMSIPPETTAKVPFNSVCLAHGKREPRPGTKFQVVRVEDVSNDGSLDQLLKLVGTGRIDQRSAQATAWHLVDKMSWQQLAAKRVERLGGAPATPYFNTAQLQLGQQLLVLAKQRAEEAEQNSTGKPQTPARAVRASRQQ